MDLSIIILNYKQKGLVKQCVKGIVAVQPQLDYEIIVVDNDSGDGTLAMVEKMFQPEVETDNNQPHLPISRSLKVPPIVTIAAEANNGFAAGNNLGIIKAQGKYLMILNPDIAVVPQALEKMVAFMEKNPSVGIIGPKLINPDGSVQYSCRRFPGFLVPIYRRTIFGKLPLAKKSIANYLMADFDHQSNQAVDWIFGACLLIGRSALEKIGLLDERFFMYFEDLDWCRRSWQEGFKVIYFSQTEMVHYHQRLSAERGGIFGVFSRGGRIHLWSGVKYFAKYLGVKPPVRP